ncbi:hypothetical protein [Tumebacillus amylolyticus]|nr:hypothetical protein [Tumebacillus amylolyticus]
MRRFVLYGAVLVAAVGLVISTTNISKTAETSPPGPAIAANYK